MVPHATTYGAGGANEGNRMDKHSTVAEQMRERLRKRAEREARSAERAKRQRLTRLQALGETPNWVRIGGGRGLSLLGAATPHPGEFDY